METMTPPTSSWSWTSWPRCAAIKVLVTVNDEVVMDLKIPPTRFGRLEDAITATMQHAQASLGVTIANCTSLSWVGLKQATSGVAPSTASRCTTAEYERRRRPALSLGDGAGSPSAFAIRESSSIGRASPLGGECWGFESSSRATGRGRNRECHGVSFVSTRLW